MFKSKFLLTCLLFFWPRFVVAACELHAVHFYDSRRFSFFSHFVRGERMCVRAFFALSLSLSCSFEFCFRFCLFRIFLFGYISSVYSGRCGWFCRHFRGLRACISSAFKTLLRLALLFRMLFFVVVAAAAATTTTTTAAATAVYTSCVSISRSPPRTAAYLPLPRLCSLFHCHF